MGAFLRSKLMDTDIPIWVIVICVIAILALIYISKKK